eukprot:Skav211170  [mRNA]  locus=scaffold1363:152961:153840:+ [translate_table: standard]
MTFQAAPQEDSASEEMSSRRYGGHPALDMALQVLVDLSRRDVIRGLALRLRGVEDEDLRGGRLVAAVVAEAPTGCRWS